MVLHHVSVLSLHLWRTFKGSSRVKRCRTFKCSLQVKSWRTFHGSSQLSIVWRSLRLVSNSKRFQVEPLTILKDHWRTFFFLRVYAVPINPLSHEDFTLNIFQQSWYVKQFETCLYTNDLEIILHNNNVKYTIIIKETKPII